MAAKISVVPNIFFFLNNVIILLEILSLYVIIDKAVCALGFLRTVPVRDLRQKPMWLHG